MRKRRLRAQSVPRRLRRLDRLAERVGERAEVARQLGEAEELGERRVGRVARVEEERATHERERGVGIRGARLRERRGLHEDRDLRGDVLRGVEAVLGEVEHEAPVVGRVVGDEQHADDVGAVLGALEQGAQTDARALASRVVAERGLVARDGLGKRVELLALHVAELAEDLGLLADALGARRRAGEELGELDPLARAAGRARRARACRRRSRRTSLRRRATSRSPPRWPRAAR